MKSNKDYVGEKINDWEIIGWEIGKKGIEWICKCKCGNIKRQKVDNIKSGRSKMCKECSSKLRKKEKQDLKERILKLKINNHEEWSEENTFYGTYKEYLEECRKRREEKKNKEKNKRKKAKEEKLEKKDKEEIGKKYARLTVIEVIRPKKGETKFRCKCDCGNEYIGTGRYIKYSNIVSCGCLSKEIKEKAIKTKRLRGIYHGMKDRCYNKNAKAYKNYGGRGLKICDEWKNSFEKFYEWAIENGYDREAPKGKFTIDRINNDGDYEPSNCRWISMQEQAKNKRRPQRKSKKYNIFNEKLNYKEIEERYGISQQLFKYRINKGMTYEEAVTTEKKRGIEYTKRGLTK